MSGKGVRQCLLLLMTVIHTVFVCKHWTATKPGVNHGSTSQSHYPRTTIEQPDTVDTYTYLFYLFIYLFTVIYMAHFP